MLLLPFDCKGFVRIGRPGPPIARRLSGVRSSHRSSLRVCQHSCEVFPTNYILRGSTKLETSNMTLDQFLAQREVQVVDMDLTACWLTLSMLSPMIFPKRLQFVYTTPMTFCRHNRKSNIFVLAARGAVGSDQDLEALDYNELRAWATKAGTSVPEASKAANMESFEALYKRCSKKGVRKMTNQ